MPGRMRLPVNKGGINLAAPENRVAVVLRDLIHKGRQ
jgi:S1-C subfamily serine protease